MAPNVSVKIMVPNSFLPRNDKLFNVLDVQVTVCFLCLTYPKCVFNANPIVKLEGSAHSSHSPVNCSCINREDFKYFFSELYTRCGTCIDI